jgi:hypothetical protein
MKQLANLSGTTIVLLGLAWPILLLLIIVIGTAYAIDAFSPGESQGGLSAIGIDPGSIVVYLVVLFGPSLGLGLAWLAARRAASHPPAR